MKTQLVIREIVFGSDDYRLEVDLRDRVLRIPIGIEMDREALKKEGSDFHIGAYVEGELLGCLILTPLEDGVIRMRQVAVDPGAQNLGIGRNLVFFAEDFAWQKSYTEIQLNARDTAIKFYEALGYEVYGPPIEEVRIPHRKMRKKLQV